MAGRVLSKSLPPVATNASWPLIVSFMGSHLLRGAQRLCEVVDDVGRRLDADRQPHQLLADAGGLKLLGIHLLVRSASGMNDQGLGVADVGEMADQPQGFDELAPGHAAAL